MLYYHASAPCKNDFCFVATSSAKREYKLYVHFVEKKPLQASFFVCIIAKIEIIIKRFEIFFTSTEKVKSRTF